MVGEEDLLGMGRIGLCEGWAGSGWPLGGDWFWLTEGVGTKLIAASVGISHAEIDSPCA